ncbi:flavin reductase like domain-containing protein [Cladorrhinum sp. PSN259]|nr:flavin reductase like domain-containing protein [Cladorrhinum sp. PSN259]
MSSPLLIAATESCTSSSCLLLLRQSRHGAWAMIRRQQQQHISKPPSRLIPPPLSRYSKLTRSNFHTSCLNNKHFRPSPPKPPSVPPSQSPSSPSISEQFRSVMRLTPHSVVVCTSLQPPPSSPSSSSSSSSVVRKGTPRAMTMSSFTSLSLSPDPASNPTISFNVAVPSRTYDAISASRRFNIHILSDDSHGARVADWLARGNSLGDGNQVFARLHEESGCEFELVADEDEHEENRTPAGVVLRGDGVLHILLCRVLNEPMEGLVRVRDHVIVLGEVMQILKGGNAGGGGGGLKKEQVSNNFGLVYADRTYRRLGECIIPGRIIDGEEEGQEG